MNHWQISKPLTFLAQRDESGFYDVPEIKNIRKFKVTQQDFRLNNSNDYIKHLQVSRLDPIDEFDWSRWEIKITFNTNLNFSELKKFLLHLEGKMITRKQFYFGANLKYNDADTLGIFIRIANEVTHFSPKMQIDIIKLMYPHLKDSKIKLYADDVFAPSLASVNAHKDVRLFQSSKHRNSSCLFWRIMHPFHKDTYKNQDLICENSFNKLRP